MVLFQTSRGKIILAAKSVNFTQYVTKIFDTGVKLVAHGRSDLTAVMDLNIVKICSRSVCTNI